MKNPTLLQRYGGHLVLFILALLLLFGARTMATNELPPLSLTAATAVVPVPPSEVADLNSIPQTPTIAPGFPVEQLPLLQDNSLAPVANPHTYRGQQPEHNFQTYEVQRGDTPGIIADRFGIKTETLLGGNLSLSDESNLLQTGVVLTILPVDGVLHNVARGETLEGIAENYDVAVEAIIGYEPNKLDFPYRLFPDTQLLIPGAAPRVFVWNPPALPAGQQFAVVGTGSFVWPITGRCMTQGYWYGHPGVDIALAEGSAVVAMDTGTVTYASWAAGGYYDYGNLIVINHGNGYETFYAHLSAINVYPGQVVYQGNFIGATGNTGRSSGPHIHIETRLNGFQDNPLFYLSGANNC